MHVLYHTKSGQSGQPQFGAGFPASCSPRLSRNAADNRKQQLHCNLNKAVVDIRLRSDLALPPGELLWVDALLASPFSGPVDDCGQKWRRRHPQHRKYVLYFNAAKWVPTTEPEWVKLQSTRVRNLERLDVWFFKIMRADNRQTTNKQTNKQTNTLVAILRSVLWEWMVKHRGCLIPNSNTGDVARRSLNCSHRACLRECTESSPYRGPITRLYGAIERTC